MGFVVDPEIVRRAQQDDKACEDLLRLLWPEAYRVALGILRDPGLAEDVAQDSCANIARSISTLRSPEAFDTWAHRSIVRQAMLVARLNPPTVALQAIPEPATAMTSADTSEVLDALAQLPLKMRTVVVLYYYAGLNTTDIGSAIGASSMTVRLQLMLARRALRKILTPTDAQSTSKETCSDAY